MASSFFLITEYPYRCMKTIDELISQLPETIFFHGQKVKAFLEITSSHVYYSTKHDNRGNLTCVFVSCNPKGELRTSLEKADKWIKEGVESGDILVVE